MDLNLDKISHFLIQQPPCTTAAPKRAKQFFQNYIVTIKMMYDLALMFIPDLNLTASADRMRGAN